MSMPTREHALALLHEAERMNPGAWVAHSVNVACAAQAIASHCDDLDAERVYSLGLLHDIGRREGVSGMKHVTDGWKYLRALGHHDAARIALTHSFPLQNPDAVMGQWDCSPEDYRAASSALMALTYNEEDRLLQLCDSLALAEGFLLIEKRLVDVFLRYSANGVNDLIAPKWRAIFALERHFSRRTGGSIYRLLPGVVENTFGPGL